eukprot:5618955-Amphidinium_carterae.1
MRIEECRGSRVAGGEGVELSIPATEAKDRNVQGRRELASSFRHYPTQWLGPSLRGRTGFSAPDIPIVYCEVGPLLPKQDCKGLSAVPGSQTLRQALSIWEHTLHCAAAPKLALYDSGGDRSIVGKDHPYSTMVWQLLMWPVTLFADAYGKSPSSDILDMCDSKMNPHMLAAPSLASLHARSVLDGAA